MNLPSLAYQAGKICYVKIPATNIGQSADFYARVFGWQIRQRGDGSTAFDDTVSQVSGAWSSCRRKARPAESRSIWMAGIF